MRSTALGAPVLFLALTLAAAAGCDASHMRGDDAGFRADVEVTTDAGACAAPAPFLICVSACGSDAGRPPECIGGRYQCPPGTVDLSTCPPFCMGAPPGPDCRCEPPRWVCPTPVPSPLACPVELEPSLGLGCGVEGQTCGDPCCEPTLACDGGVWGPGPIADCAWCDESQFFPCGPGRCGRGQACQTDCGPTDAPVFSCQVLVDDCGGCGCVEVPPGSTCEERDGHLYVVSPRCG
jgi:hypothetical protein